MNLGNGVCKRMDVKAKRRLRLSNTTHTQENLFKSTLECSTFDPAHRTSYLILYKAYEKPHRYKTTAPSYCTTSLLCILPYYRYHSCTTCRTYIIHIHVRKVVKHNTLMPTRTFPTCQTTLLCDKV